MSRPALALLATVAFAALVAPCAPAAAQTVQRMFPANALRGRIVIGEAPQILLNGNAALLSPGARIHGVNNLSVVPAELIGSRLLVNYTFDSTGLVNNVWILNRAEARVEPWPRRLDETQTWRFDASAQTWSKP